MFTLQPSFKLGGGVGGGGGKAVVEETVNSMEENYQGFCLNYFQEFGLG
jgi:hypothetical protein